MKRLALAAVVSALLVGTICCDRQPGPRDDLPRVLLIGDSISIEYTPLVAELLQDVAVVERNPGNAQHTGTGVRLIDQWLGDSDWEVIHFNWGLWDFTYRSPSKRKFGDLDKIRGTPMIPLEDYERNLDQLVRRLKRTGATLIWACSTVVPEGEPGRFVGDDLKYNQAAAAVMARHGVRVNDLYALTREFSPSMFRAPADVHFAPQGNRLIAAQVAAEITDALAAGDRGQ